MARRETRREHIQPAAPDSVWTVQREQRARREGISHAVRSTEELQPARRRAPTYGVGEHD
jgi:hypothetical protein